MILLLASVLSLLICLITLGILLKARGKLKAQSITLLIMAAGMQSISSISSILGTISLDKYIALNYFIISIGAFTTALLFGMMFIELIRTGKAITKITMVGAIFFGYLFMEPITTYNSLLQNLFRVNNYWERTSLRGSYGRIMIILFMLIVLLDFLVVAKLYLTKTKTPEKRKMTYLFTIGIVLFAFPYLTISPLSFINPAFKIIIVPAQFIFSSLGWLVLSIVIAKNAYFANLLTQTIQAFLLIRKSDGTLIYSKIFVEPMKEKESLFASFLTATTSAMSEVIEVGSMRTIFFEKIVLNFAMGNVSYAALLTDTGSSIIQPVLNELLLEIERTIPKDELLSPATEYSTIEKIDKIVEKVLYPLLP